MIRILKRLLPSGLREHARPIPEWKAEHFLEYIRGSDEPLDVLEREFEVHWALEHTWRARAVTFWRYLVDPGQPVR